MNHNIALPKRRHPELVSGSIWPHTLPKRRQTQPHRQINPLRIMLIDQIDLPRAMPVFQLLFAQDRALHVPKQLKVHQLVDRIFGRMPRRHVIAMLVKPLKQVRGHADIERAVKLTRKDIHARLLFLSHVKSLAEEWTLKQVQGDGIFALCASPQLQLHAPRHPELVSGSIERFVQSERVALKRAAK